jgi:molybdopterin-guanine dinucleotide biosynthesis protein A
MPTPPGDAAVAIVAGGLGERLGGRSKALLPLGPGGTPLLQATATLLASLGAPLILSVRGEGDIGPLLKMLAGHDLRVVRDREDGLGPLGGLAAVLDASPRTCCLVVACDMPFLSRPLLERLLSLSHEHEEATAVVPRTARGLHPLHAVYRRSLLPAITERLARRALALHELLGATPTYEVAEPELRRYDPDLRSLENVNTPDDLARAVGADAARRMLG